VNAPLKTIVAAAALGAALATGCTSPAPKNEAKRETLAIDSRAALQKLTIEDPSLQSFLDKAFGYVIFPSVGKGGLIVGASYGRGEVYRQGQLAGYADITAGSFGLQAGGQTFTELLVFGTEKAYNDFADGDFALSANASAIALKAGAAGEAQFNNGVAVFVKQQGGLMGELSLGGQRLRFSPLSQAPSSSSMTTTTTTGGGTMTTETTTAPPR
jgi:lipid-binding SYLF domain-containing protein